MLSILLLPSMFDDSVSAVSAGLVWFAFPKDGRDGLIASTCARIQILVTASALSEAQGKG